MYFILVHICAYFRLHHENDDIHSGSVLMRIIVCVTELCWCPLAVSLRRRIPAVQHGAGGHSLVPQHSVHALRVFADFHHQLGAFHREEHVRQLWSGDLGQIPAEGESPSTYLHYEGTNRPKIIFWGFLFIYLHFFFTDINVGSELKACVLKTSRGGRRRVPCWPWSLFWFGQGWCVFVLNWTEGLDWYLDVILLHLKSLWVKKYKAQIKLQIWKGKKYVNVSA